jgi:hypothetical protein
MNIQPDLSHFKPPSNKHKRKQIFKTHGITKNNAYIPQHPLIARGKQK